jgi:hypothetical protein
MVNEECTSVRQVHSFIDYGADESWWNNNVARRTWECSRKSRLRHAISTKPETDDDFHKEVDRFLGIEP